MNRKLLMLVATTMMLLSNESVWGQQENTDDVSYLSKVSLKKRVSEESFLFKYPTGYEQTVNKEKKSYYYYHNKKEQRKQLYKKGLESTSNPKRALRYFIQSVKKCGDRDASYQVGHYYCFGVFDITGINSRKGRKPIDAKKGLSYLNFASPNKLCQVFADKDSWMFDPRRAVYCGIIPDLLEPFFATDPAGNKYYPTMVESLIKEYAGKYNFNFERYFVDNFNEFDNGVASFLYRISELAYLRDFTVGYTNINKSDGDSEYKNYLSSHYLLQGFDFLKKEDEPRALFNFAKAGYGGNVDGFRMTVSMISEHCAKKSYTRNIDKLFQLCSRYRRIYSMIEALRIPKNNEFYSEYQVLLEEAKTKEENSFNDWGKKLDAEREAKQAKRARFWNAFAQAVASGAAVAAQGMVAQQQNYIPRYVPTTTLSTGFSTDYYNSSAYLTQAQARADQTLANFKAQTQLIGRQALAQNQQMLNRSNEMYGKMSKWIVSFQNQNGRVPTQYETTQWVQQNYPDMLESYLVAISNQSGKYSKENAGEKESSTETEVSNKSDCTYCGGTGRILQESEVLNFGLPEKDYKCQECGKWKYKGYTHVHKDCPHCRGGKK